jgi:RNA polymerase sigma factor (sigma-70 family)
MPPSPPSNLLAQLRRAALLRDGAGLSDGQLLGEFVRSGDEAAFTALVRRHAAMVLGVCRRLVGDDHAAEDTFQAVFLVLARRAAAVRPREQLGNWLYGVAFRTALKARAGLARRRAREKQVPAMPHPAAPPPPDLWHDLQAILDEELARLPDKLRAPVVLCDLEGRPQRDVARQLGLALATLAGRLAAARRLLAGRLTKRGVALSGGALASVISAGAAAASVPPPLVAAAARLAGGVAVVSARVSQLCEGVMRMMFLSKLRSYACCLAAALALAGGGFQVSGLAASEPAPAATPREEARPPAPRVPTRLNDAEYLRRVCRDLCGRAPSEVEVSYFLPDADPLKRAKVVEWLLAEKDAHVKRGLLELSRLSEIEIGNDNGVRDVQGGALSRLATAVGGADWERSRPEGVHEATPEVRVLGEEVVPKVVHTRLTLRAIYSDEAFLARACRDARGGGPTPVEAEYFRADKDPKKREKLLDLLLKDPTVAKRLGEAWKRKMLEAAVWSDAEARDSYTDLLTAQFSRRAVPAHLERLLGQLLEAKRSEEQVLDALAAAILGRLPTEGERRLVLAALAKQSNKREGWREVIVALEGTSEARRHAAELGPRPRPEAPERK